MVLTEEVIQRVQSLYSKGVQSKNTRLSSRHIYSCLISARATLLQQKYNKGQYTSEWNYSPLHCVALEDAPVHECPCAPDGVTMLRSKIILPRVISGIDMPLIYSVTTLDNATRLDRKEYNTYKYKKGAKFTSAKPFYIINNGGRLFVGSKTRIKSVAAKILAYDPYEAYIFPNSCDECKDCKCKSPFEVPFPIDGELINTLIEMASKEAVILFGQMKEDKEANASDDGVSQGTMVHQPE